VRSPTNLLRVNGFHPGDAALSIERRATVEEEKKKPPDEGLAAAVRE
jgi:hypothetical protein